MGARSSKNTSQNNRSDGHLLEYFRSTFIRGGAARTPVPFGLIATGGSVSTYFIGPIGITIYWFIRIFYSKRINLYD